MELRLLRYFVAVAETEHVGRAAERLHISQSPLSRQIAQLEAELGTALFVRERRRIRLTETGRWLLGEARRLLARATSLATDAKRVASGEMGRVKIGFVSSAMSSGVLPAAIRTARASHPSMAIELTQLASAAQLDLVTRGELDVGVVHTAVVKDLVATLVLEEPYVLAVSNDHPLARRRSITPEQLDGAPWIMLSHERSRDRMIAACGAAGFAPSVVAEVGDRSSVLALIGAGVGIGLVPSIGEMNGVVSRKVSWLSLKNRLWAVRRDRSGALPEALVEAMRAVFPSTKKRGPEAKWPRTTLPARR